MEMGARKVKIFKIKNRNGYAALCTNHLTEGKTLIQAYSRMGKALKRNGIKLKNQPQNLKKLLTSV